MRDYLLGKLSPADRRKLEEELESDPSLSEALQLQRDIMIGIQAGFDDQLREKLQQIDNLQEKEKPAARRILWQWASAAAVLLGTLGVYIYMNQTSPDERLFLSYFQDYPNVVQPVQRDQEAPSQLEAFTAYQNREYEEAFLAFTNQEAELPEVDYPTFYKGICALHLDDWTAAIEAFEKVRAGADNRFEEAATWYVALAYLRAGNRDRAHLIFESIAEQSGSFQEDAKAIVEQLQ